MISLSSIAYLFFIAAAPIIERGALPLALNVFKMPLVPAFIIVVAGNSAPAIAVIYLLDPVLNWLGKYIPVVQRFANIMLAHFRKRVHPWVDRYGTVGLMIFVAIPTPLTGAWTGSGAAAVLGMHRKRAVFAIIAGVIIADLLILAIDLGAVKLFF